MDFARLSETKTNVLSGLIVALALVPEAIAFSLIAHVPPLVGLYAAFVVCLVTSVIGGRPGMISGATGALAVVMVALVVRHGIQYLFATVVLMGVLQVVFGALKLGKLIRMVPHPVMLGFVNGLAIVIFLAQLDQFKLINPDGSTAWLQGAPLYTMLGLVTLTMAIIYLLPRLTRAVPASLAAIAVVSSVVIFFHIDTKTVGDLASIKGGLPQFHIPAPPLTWHTLAIVLPYSLILAGIGLIESLLTLNLIDEMTQTPSRPNRVCVGQGVANVVTGFLGGMGGCAMIGQSMINVTNGAIRKSSGVAAGLFLICFILFGSQWIEQIPVAALVGLMFVVAERTFEWGSVRLFGRVPVPDIIVGLTVAAATVLTDLAVAVLIGTVVSALVFAWKHAKQMTVTATTDEAGRRVYELHGSLFFASTQNFLALFGYRDDPDEVVIDFHHARVIDHSGLEAIDTLAERYAGLGKQLHLRHLSGDCRALLNKAMVEVSVLG